MHRFGARRTDGTIDVTFSVREDDASIDVILDIDFLLHPAWPDIEHLVLRPVGAGGEREAVVRLPADVELTYRFLRRPRRGHRPKDLDALRELVASGAADPDLPVFLRDAFGSGTTATRLIGPDAAPGHAAWRDDRPSVPVSRRELVLDDRTPTLLVPETGVPVPRLVLMLDGDVWLGSLGIAEAVGRWNHGRAAPAAFVIVPTPDRETLANRAAMIDLVADRVLPAASAALGTRFPGDAVAVAGQSYGGLAAAGLVVDRPATIRTAVISSGSFWFTPERDARDDTGPGLLTRELAGLSLWGTRFLLHVGREEGTMVDQSRMFADAAGAAGADATCETRPGGHDYAWYRHAVLDALDRW